MEQEISNSSTYSINPKWAISLVFVCLGIIGYGYLYSKNTTSNLGFLFGENLVYGLFVFVIFNILIKAITSQKQTNTVGVNFFTFLAIFISLTISSLIGYQHQKNEVTQMASEIQNRVSTIAKSGIDAQGVPQRIEEKLDTAPVAKGDSGEMERFMKTQMNKMVSLRNDYLLELDAIGWDKIFDMDRIKQDSSLVESKAMIKKAKDIVVKYKEKTHNLFEGSRMEIDNLNLSGNSKQEFIRGYEDGIANARTKTDTLWDLEAKVVSEFESIFALLDARKSSWAIQNGQILFADNSDLDTFNSYIAKIQELTAKEEAIQKVNIGELNNKLDNFKN